MSTDANANANANVLVSHDCAENLNFFTERFASRSDPECNCDRNCDREAFKSQRR